MALDKNGKTLPKGISWREKDNLYMARFTYHGTPYTFYDKDLKSITKTLANKRYEVEHGLNGNTNKMNLNQWYKIWLQEYKKPVIKETTVKAYKNLYENHIQHQLGMMQLTQIRPIHIQKIYNEFTASGLSSSHLGNLNIMLNNLFSTALKNDLIIKNPCLGVSRPKVVKKESRVLTIEEQKTILKYVKDDKWNYYEPLIVTLLGTGLRIGETIALTWDDIDFKNKCIKINKTLIYIKDEKTNRHTFKIQSPKSETSNRTIPLQEEVEKVLKRQLISQKELKLLMGCKWTPIDGLGNLVFTGLNGKPYLLSGIQSFLKKMIMQINDDEMQLAQKEHREAISMKSVNPHCFRHTFATRCFEFDIPPKTVQQLLGHSSIQMTMDLYTHVSEKKKKEDIDKLNRLFKIS